MNNDTNIHPGTYRDSTTNGVRDWVDEGLEQEARGISAWRRDLTLSDEAKALIYRVLNFIRHNPEKWDQGVYGNHLTDSNCFMGLVCRLSGVKTSFMEYFAKRFPGDESRADLHAMYSEYGASKLLGIDQNIHTDRLNFVTFYMSETNENYDPSKPAAHDNLWSRLPTLEEMVERISIAFSHDFRDYAEHDTTNTTDTNASDLPNAEMDANDRIHDQM